MISLRKHIDSYGVQAAAAPVTAFREILLAISKAGSEATPYLGEELCLKLKALTEKLGEAPAPNHVQEIHAEADRELAAWGQSAAGYLREKAQEVRELMIAVANAAASTTERDQRYATRMHELTNQLQSIAKLDDLTSVRRSLAQSASEFKSCTEKMTSEGAAAISQLTAEVSAYRTKLEESERKQTTDPLTSLLNRRGIETALDGQIAGGKTFSLAILDLNGFKQINDQHGHLVGDDLLRQFAAELQTQLRPGIVGRWGGDEFVVVIAGSIGQARATMERIRSWVFGSYSLKLPNKPDNTLRVDVTAAIGIAQWNGGKESHAELFARADQSMYEDKRSSRESAGLLN